MKLRIFIVLAIVFSAYGLSYQPVQAPLQHAAVRAPASVFYRPASCEGKRYCITVFVAPWCGVCRSFHPKFKALQQYINRNRHDIGFGLVMTNGEEADMVRQKNELAPIEVKVDLGDVLMNSNAVSGFPMWRVTDINRHEIYSNPGAIPFNPSDIPAVLGELEID